MVQILNINNLEDAYFELKKIKVSTQGIAYMAKKNNANSY